MTLEKAMSLRGKLMDAELQALVERLTTYDSAMNAARSHSFPTVVSQLVDTVNRSRERDAKLNNRMCYGDGDGNGTYLEKMAKAARIEDAKEAVIEAAKLYTDSRLAWIDLNAAVQTLREAEE